MTSRERGDEEGDEGSLLHVVSDSAQ